MRGGVIDSSGQLTRIGVFYDGSYFNTVSNYYRHEHARQARLSIRGLHNFIKDEVARKESSDVHYCQVVDAHYFRGRLDTQDALERDTLSRERKFDEILMREGIVTHYLPVRKRSDGTPREKGIDVWFSLEAFELAIYKRFNVIALIAGDGDFLPLVRKLNTIGTRVMVLGWDIKWTSTEGRPMVTRASQALIDEATYPIMMNTVIDDRTRQKDPLISGLFLRKFSPGTVSGKSSESQSQPLDSSPGTVSGRIEEGVIRRLLERENGPYGFIEPCAGDGKHLYFNPRHLKEGQDNFNVLKEGDTVSFVRKLALSGEREYAVAVRRVSSARDASQ